MSPETQAEINARIDEERLVETARSLVDIPSPTGDEAAMAERMQEIFEAMGLPVTWQEVEDGRPNVIGIWEGSGGGKTLMFNGHMDTSYSGREPHLRPIPGFQPSAFLSDGRIYGLGIANMKGALAAYVEAVRALQDGGARLKGDIMLAAVVGEIEKTQWGEEFRGKEYRGYAAGSRYLAAHGMAADMCVLGEPTEQRIVLGHYGALWARVSTHGPFIHTAFSEGRLGENSILRMQEVTDAIREWIPSWEERAAYRGMRGVVNIGAIRGGHPWRASRTPNRTDLFLDVRVPPTMSMQEARGAFRELVEALRTRFGDYGIESEVYVTAPGSEIAEEHELVQAIDAGHTAVHGSPPERDATRWFSDGSALTRYGIETVNYGTSSGLPGADGESLSIKELAQTAAVYARVAARICEATT